LRARLVARATFDISVVFALAFAYLVVSAIDQDDDDIE